MDFSPFSPTQDEFWMQKALAQAQEAYHAGEVPVGAVLVSSDGKLIAQGRNEVERLHDVSAHAEFLAITAATYALQSKYLKDCTLYVSLEPCVMCAGMLRWAQIGRIVYAASDEKMGFSNWKPAILHPKTLVTSGVLAEKSTHLLKSFFQNKR